MQSVVVLSAPSWIGRSREALANPLEPRQRLVISNEALLGVEDPALSAAILDHAFSDGDSAEVCARMKERSIPFVTYSGYDHLGGTCRGGVHVKKPASMSVLVATVKGLLAQCQIAN